LCRYKAFIKLLPVNRKKNYSFECARNIDMTRRVYYIDPKKKQQKQEFISSYRKALRSIDPELLEKTRMAIANAIIDLKEHSYSDKDNSASQMSSTGLVMVPVDHKKNMSIIEKYMELQSGNAKVHEQVRELISEDIS
jgi:hypothetical protein